MTYKEKLKLYQQGKLSETEKAELEKEIEKQDAISEYLYEESCGDLGNDFMEEQTSEETESKNFAEMIERSIRKAFVKLGVVVGVVVLVISLSVIFLLPNVVSLFYYNPNKTVGTEQESGISTSQMSLDLSVYTELFVPGEHRNYVQASGRGYGVYDIFIPGIIADNDNRFHSVGGRLERGELMLYDSDIFRKPASNAFLFPPEVTGTGFSMTDTDGKPIGSAGSVEEARKQIENLDENQWYLGYVSLSEILSYEDFYRLISGMDLTWQDLWCAVYTENEHGDLIEANMGFCPFASGMCVDWDREKYPVLSLLDNQKQYDASDAEQMKQHFISLLSYLSDHEEIVPMMEGKEKGKKDAAVYRKMMESVEKDGLKLYGFAITAQKKDLEKLFDDPRVSYIYAVGK